MNKTQTLEALKKIVQGVLKDGRYVFLMGDNEILKAISVCHSSGVSLHDINTTINEVRRQHELSRVSVREAEENR